jgi:hypothetical protein
MYSDVTNLLIRHAATAPSPPPYQGWVYEVHGEDELADCG